MPAAAPILFIAGLAGIIALLVGGRKADAAPKQLPPPILPPPVPLPEPKPAHPACSDADKKFVSDVVVAAQKGTATVEMINKAMAVAHSCGNSAAIIILQKALADIQKKVDDAKKTGAVKVTKVTESTTQYVCGVIPGKGYACRAKEPGWRAKAKQFQNALNIAAFKLPGPAETPKLIKVDGAIGVKTQHLLEVVAKRIELPKFEAFKNIASMSNPETISGNLTFLTGALTRYIQLKSGKGAAVSGIGHYGMEHISPLPGVSPEKWTSFVLSMKGRGGDKGIGPFKIRPLEMRKYNLTDEGTGLESQYKNFAKYMQALSKKVLATPALRSAVESGELTLSGLLALMKQAGPKGALSWIQNPGDRERFPNTTEAVLACNGIF